MKIGKSLKLSSSDPMYSFNRHFSNFMDITQYHIKKPVINIMNSRRAHIYQSINRSIWFRMYTAFEDMQ